MNYKVLNNGVKMPCIAFGTWNLEMGSKAKEAVLEALKVGYRSIDCAYSYGNDFSVGKAIKESGISREDLFVTNKVWNDFRTKDSVVEVCKKSLKLMKLDYFDLYLVHWPVSEEDENWKQINFDVWQGMEQLYKEGFVKAIGVSNFNQNQIEALKECGAKILPMVNQIEFHPGYLQEEIVAYCKANDIVVEAWSPLGSGNVFENKTLKTIAKKHGKSVAQICLKWEIQKGVVPIPRSSNPERIAGNIDVFDFELSEEDIALIDSITDIAGNLFKLN